MCLNEKEVSVAVAFVAGGIFEDREGWITEGTVYMEGLWIAFSLLHLGFISFVS